MSTDPRVAREHIFDALLSSTVPVALFAWRNLEDWPVEFVSPNVEHVLGYTAEQFTTGARSYASIIHPDDLPGVGEEVKENSLSGVSAFEHEDYRIVDPSGEIRWVQDHTAIVRNAEGEITHYLGYILNITARRAAVEALRLAKLTAERANQAKSNFLAVMSHEIRTPMNGVVGMTGLLLDTDLDSEQREFALIARRSAGNLLSIINDVLDFSRIESGKLEVEELSFDLQVAVEETVDLLGSRADGKGLDLFYELDSDLPSRVRSDPGRLRQILINLVGNAIKFTEAGSVQIHVSRAGPSDEGVFLARFEVKDTGPGIPAEACRAIFEPFAQLAPFSERSHEGSGLGLPISRQLSELLGGEIGVESAPGQGSTFWFTLRLREEQPLETAEVAPTPLEGLRALCVGGGDLGSHLAQACLRWGTQVDLASGIDEVSSLLDEEDPYRAVMLGEEDASLQDLLDLLDTLDAPPAVILLRSYHERRPREHPRLKLLSVRRPVLLSTLRNTLLRAVGEEPSATEADSRASVIANHVRQLRARVLVVEDNAINQRLVTVLMTRLGFRVDAVANGREAIEAVQAIPYDLVLMDCQMPVMGGLEATRQLRKLSPPVGQIPVVALTANAMPSDEERCLAAGMNDYLSKPLAVEDLERVVRRWVLEPAAEAQPPSLGHPARTEA